jgi:hypothetical protein
MSILFWGLTLGVIGKILVAVGILKVHYVMAMERSIDEIVIRTFWLEKVLTITGILFIVVGYCMEIYFYGLTPLLTCMGESCQTAATILSQ